MSIRADMYTHLIAGNIKKRPWTQTNYSTRYDNQRGDIQVLILSQIVQRENLIPVYTAQALKKQLPRIIRARAIYRCPRERAIRQFTPPVLRAHEKERQTTLAKQRKTKQKGFPRDFEQCQYTSPVMLCVNFTKNQANLFRS